MAEIMRYVNLFGGLAVGGTGFVIGLNDLYQNETLPAAPDSIILTVITLAAFALTLTSVIGLIGKFQGGADDESKELMKQTQGFHARISGRLVMLTALYAGLQIGKKQLFTGTWTLAEGLFLAALIYKGFDAAVDFLATLMTGDENGSYKPLTNVSVADKMSRDFVGFTAMLIAFILFMVNHGLDEVFDKYTTDDDATGVPTFKNTSLMEESGKVDKPLLNWAMILSIIVLASIFILVGLAANMKNYILGAVGSLSSAVSHVVSALLAVHVGKYLHVEAYDTADGDFLPSNFFYLGAAVLAAYAAINFDSKDIIEEDENKTASKGTVRDAALFAMASGAFALWSTQTLYSNVNYLGKVNITKADNSTVEVTAPVVSKARELGMYALTLVIFLSFQGFAIKLFETLIKTGGSFAGLFQGIKAAEEDRFSTLRAEQAVTFAIASAVLWGSKVDQGAAKGLGDGTLVSLWLLWVVAAAGRFMGWLNVLSDKGVAGFAQLFNDDKIKRIFSDENGNTKVTIPCLGAVSSIILSFVAYSIFFFSGSDADSWKLFGNDYITFFQGLTWFLLLAHVVLTILGCIPGIKMGNAEALHAGWIPILRFGVSSVVIWTTGIAAGQNLLKRADEGYAFVAFALYLTYDVLAQGKF